MKKFLFYLLLFVSLGARAQDYIINFDTLNAFNDTHLYGSPTYYPDSSWVYIDTVHYLHNKWQVGRPGKSVFTSAYSLPNAIVTDTINSCTPNDTSVFTLEIPTFVYLGLSELWFFYKLDVDSGDIALIECTSDSGAHWKNALSPGNGILYNWGDTVLSTAAGWQSLELYGVDSSWIDTVGKFNFLRFTFISGSSATPRDGWIIDDISIIMMWEKTPSIAENSFFKVFPNPVTSVLSINASGNLNTIEIVNIFGQTIFSAQPDARSLQVNVADFPPGVYTVKANKTQTTCFVKQ